MDNFKKLIFFLAGVTILFSCKKDADQALVQSGAITVANLVNNGNSLNFGSTSQVVGLNAVATYPVQMGPTQIILADKSVTPSITYFNQSVVIGDGRNYSLFLAGTSPSAAESVMINETYTNFTDSLCGVRFINLGNGNKVLSINISGKANGSEVSSLAYKEYSQFKQYPAKKTNSTYSFDIRDAKTGSLIKKYSLATPYFHNVTIAFYGTSGIARIAHP